MGGCSLRQGCYVYKLPKGYLSVAIHEELHEGEKIILETHPHRWVYAWWYFAGVVLMFTLYGFVIGIPYLAVGAFYSKIQDLHFTQNLFERIFGIGTVHINTAGGADVEISFKGISPSVKRIIEEHVGKHHAVQQ